MDRRKFLRRSSALGALTLAGCMADANDNESGGNESPSDDESESDEISIADSSVERTDSGCSSGEDSTASVSIDDETNTVTFSGHVVTGTPCYDITISRATYKQDDGWLTVDLGTEREDKVCVDCVGRIDFGGSVDLDGGVPSRVTISHDDSVLADTDDESDDTQPAGEKPELQASSFAVTAVRSRDFHGTAGVTFDSDDETVTVTGTIVGDDGCATADLGTAEYDAADDELSVDVVTRERKKADDEICTQQTVGIDYEATFSFDGGIPSRASVSHDGHGIMAAGHGSSSASAPESDT